MRTSIYTYINTCKYKYEHIYIYTCIYKENKNKYIKEYKDWNGTPEGARIRTDNPPRDWNNKRG